MRRQLNSIVLALVLILSGCPAEVDTRDNPYDPQGTNPAPAILDATFLLPGATTSAGISVSLSEGSAEVAPGTTDDAGQVRFLDLAPGSYRLRASFPGHAAYERSVQLAPAQELVLGAVELEPRGSSLVTLVGQVEVEGASYHGGVLVRTDGAPYSTVTAADGSFTLSLPPGSYDVELETRDHQPVSRPGVEAPADLGTIVLPILPHTILVDVQRSVCGASPPMEAPAEGALVEVLSAAGTVVDSALVDALGAASLLGVPGGRFEARISLAGYRSQSQSFEIHDGQTLNLSPVILEAQRGGLVGTVSLENATSFAGTVISLQGTSYSTITSESGAYALTEICGGLYDLIATTTRVGYLPVTRAGAQISDGAITTIEPLTLRVQTGGFTLNSGNPYTATVDIPYDLTAPVGTSEMRISEDGDLFQNPARTDEGWEPYFQAGTVTLGATEGQHSVLAQTRTAAGVVSTVHQATVTVDTTPPLLDQVQIDVGSGFSNDAAGNLILQLTGSDLPAPGANTSSGVAWVRIFDADVQACAGGPGACPPSPADWLSVPVEDFRVFLAHTALRPLADEEKEVWVRLGDAAGNWGVALQRNTTLDRIAPAGTGITALGTTPGWSSSSTISVQLTATDLNPVQVRLANDSTFAGAIWRPFVDELTWFLASGEGAREVWVEFRDVAGNRSGPFSDTLTVDTLRPTASLFAVAEAPYAPSENLTLDLGTAGGFEIRIDEDGSPGTWQPVPAGSLPYTATMPAGPGGTRTVNLLLDVRDEAHNTLETPRSVSVVIDRDAPADPSVSIVEGAVVTVANVTLRVAAETGPTHAAEMRLTLNGSPQGWIPYAFQQTVGLSAGANTLGVEVRDLAGNTNSGGARSVTVEYDTAAPTLGAILLEGGADWTDSRSVSLTVPVTSGDDPTRLQLRTSTVAGLPGAPWGAYSPTVPVTLEDREGLQTVHVEVRDAAGLVVAGQDDIRLDRIAPTSLGFEVPAYTASATPSGISVEVLEAQALGLELSGVVAVYGEDPTLGDLDCSLDAAGALAAALPPLGAVDVDTSSCLSTPCTLSLAPSLPAEGRYRLQVCFRDVAGNAEVQPREQVVVFDATPPDLAAAPVLVADGRQLTASWAALADQGPAGVIDHYELQVDTTPAFGAGTTTLGPIAASATGTTVSGLENRVRYWVRLRAVDPAGNARAWGAASPPAADVLVGMRAVNLPLAGGHAATDPAMASVGSTMWVASGDLRFVGYGSETRYRLYSCDLDSGQCGIPSAWQEVVLDAALVGQAQPVDLAMVASGRHLWVAAIVETSLGRGVELLGCELASDCLDSANWSITVLEGINPDIGRRISLAEDGGVLRLAFANRAGFLYPGLRVCAEPNDCTLEPQWSAWMTPVPTGSMDWSISSGGAIQILAENANTVLIWDKVPSGGPSGVGVVASNGNDRSYDLSTWVSPALAGTSVRLDSAIRMHNRIYLVTNDFGSVRALATCDFDTLLRYPSASCASGWVSIPLWTGATSQLSRVALGTTVDGLHATWWSEASQSLEYGFCRYPQTQSCAIGTNWTIATLRSSSFLNRRPFPAGNGVDVMVAGKNDQGTLTVNIPIVPGPKNPTGALDAGLGGIGWDPSGTAAGYDFLSVPQGAAPFGQWSSVVPIPDPLRAQATLSATPGSTTRVGVRTRSASGGLSDDSQIIRVQPLQPVKGIGGAVKVSSSSWDFYRAVAGAVDLGGPMRLDLRICDFSSTECRADADWAAVSLRTFDGIKAVQVRQLGDELWVSATYTEGGNDDALSVWSCDLMATGGCTTASDFRRTDLVPANVLWARMALHDNGSESADRVGFLYYDYNLSQEHLVQCVDGGGDCKAGTGTWTDDVVTGIPSGLDGSGGHDLALSGSEAVIAYVPTAAVAVIQNLWVVRCTGSGFFFSCSNYSIPQAVQWHSGAVRIALRNESAPVVVGAYDRTLHVFSCSGTPEECTDGSAGARWSETRLDSYFYLDGHSLTLGALGRELRVLYQLDGQFTFASCRDRCDRNDSWRRARVYFDREASPSSVSQDAGWYDPLVGDFGLIVPGNRAGLGIGTDILTGGAIDPIY